jgi:predicted phage terminase large subunit-like protein
MTHKPTLSVEMQDMIRKHPELLLKLKLRTQLKWFIAKCFGTLNPGSDYLPNWHIEAIAWKLEQVRLGHIKRLIITMPPRSAKSISASVAFPAFIHGHDPTKEIITVSYAQSLASKLHNDYRTILTSEWCKELFPDARIDPKKETEQEVRLTRRGVRLATSVGGVLTGRGADIIIIDDPLKADDAHSEALRNKVNEWYSSALVSRINHKTTGAIVIVTQRLHVDDLVGHVTEFDDSWTVLNLPAIAQEDQQISVGPKKYHKRSKGTLLHPARETQSVLDELKLNIGSAAFEAQYQQSPVPPGGHLFKREWLKYYPFLPEITDDDTVFQSWDTASKTGLQNDWSVGTTWLYKNGHYYLMDVVRDKLNYPDLKARMIAAVEKHKPWLILIEDTGVGTGLIEDLRSQGFDVIDISATQAKEARANIQTPKFESGRVWLPEKAPWLSELETELLAFPAGRHDDQVDSIVQALAYDGVEKGTVTYININRPNRDWRDPWSYGRWY